MSNLIRADLRRILGKRSFHIILMLVAALALVSVLWDRFHFWNGFVYAAHMSSYITGIGAVLIGVTLFSAVYADEFRACSLQAVIGRGITRGKILIVKIIDCAILTVVVYACFLVFLLLLSLITGAAMDGSDIKILVFSTISAVFVLICATPLAAVVIFATDNIALATFADLALLSIIPLAFELIGMTIIGHNLHLADYTISGFADRAFSGMMLGTGGIGDLFFGALIYIGLAFLLSYLVFRKKELEL